MTKALMHGGNRSDALSNRSVAEQLAKGGYKCGGTHLLVNASIDPAGKNYSAQGDTGRALLYPRLSFSAQQLPILSCDQKSAIAIDLLIR
jgi:hypothetical protein